MAVEKEDIIQYVQETPGNSNPAVLRSLLNQFEGSGEGATFKVEKEDDEKTYQSAYTGEEIDAAVAKAGNLPATTSADAGKALVVDSEGKIVPGEVSGGGGVLVLAFATETTLNHTYAEVLAAYQNGSPVIFNMREFTAVGTIAPQQDGSVVMTFTQVGYNSVMSRAEFGQIILTYNSDNTFAVDFKSYYWNVTALE